MRPSTFPVSIRPHLTALWRFLCVHQRASVCRENEEKREGKTDGQRVTEKERKRVPVREDAEERHGGTG